MPHTARRLQILREKADAGDARAQYELGLTFYRGDGVPQDMKEARVWLTKAADQGQRDAQVLLNLEGLRLDQGVQFKLGAKVAKKPEPEPEVVTRKNVAVSVPLRGNQATHLMLMNDIREAIEETRRVLPDNEDLKDRILEGLGQMLDCLKTGNIPDAHTRGMMSLGNIAYRGLEGYGLEAYKAKVSRISRAFEDLKTPVKPPARTVDGPVKASAEGAADSATLDSPAPGGPLPHGTIAGDKFQQVAGIVDRIEAELRRLGWWSDTPPTAEQMAFTAAFAMDTMPLAMWVQFVLLPRVRAIIAQRDAFPASSMVGAHATREFDGQDEAEKLVRLLNDFDDVVMA